ncbi:hypothetical protein M378DRAFT_164269 [Amanita muscaria Koide BX008]|uniref:Uncharacterized protein n=1 Tax=Amanita muscaria (strain Koide BX008) TaxID=946122 RepID=A0A0C2X4G6_AMAMK|nr:hypothetical protein M378DRAFT_174008 [Amanita muscaria Koide BX008]KIL63588.1 hypothetical protein M378DRAFT_164269 [Amanita muscaria Koide BX008]
MCVFIHNCPGLHSLSNLRVPPVILEATATDSTIRSSNTGNNSAPGGAKAKCSNCGATHCEVIMGTLLTQGTLYTALSVSFGASPTAYRWEIISHVLVPVVESEHWIASL